MFYYVHCLFHRSSQPTAPTAFGATKVSMTIPANQTWQTSRVVELDGGYGTIWFISTRERQVRFQAQNCNGWTSRGGGATMRDW